MSPLSPAEHLTHDESAGPASPPASSDREAVMHASAAAAFLVLFQAYLVAPLIPSLSAEFHSSAGAVGLLVPGYMLPYGASTLFFGPISDRFGRRRVFVATLGMLALTIVGATTARSINQLLAWRIVAGVASGGVIPIALALIGDLYEYRERGRPIGWIFGAVAGGSSFGSTLGALLNPIIGWRAVLGAIAVGCGGICLIAARVLPDRQAITSSNRSLSLRTAFDGYWALLADRRGRSGYTYILFNGIFHSGIFTWLGPYFATRYGLGDTGIGLALVGYGLPGMLLGPAIGRLADRFGRRTIIPAGIFLSSLTALALIPSTPLAWTVPVVTALSLGFDMSHPLLAGIITSLDPSRRGQAMGLNAFALFTGFGLGALFFQLLLENGFAVSLAIFACVELILAVLAFRSFHAETPHGQEKVDRPASV